MVRVRVRTVVNFGQIGTVVDVDGIVFVPEAHPVHGEEEQGEAVQEVREARRKAVLRQSLAQLAKIGGLRLSRRRRDPCCRSHHC